VIITEEYSINLKNERVYSDGYDSLELYVPWKREIQRLQNL